MAELQAEEDAVGAGGRDWVDGQSKREQPVPHQRAHPEGLAAVQPDDDEVVDVGRPADWLPTGEDHACLL
eukprot:2682360-Lingulodinium_polyedra.AAC.1